MNSPQPPGIRIVPCDTPQAAILWELLRADTAAIEMLNIVSAVGTQKAFSDWISSADFCFSIFATDSQDLIGFLRFVDAAHDPHGRELQIYLVDQSRGKGHARQAIQTAMKHPLFQDVHFLVANVRVDNNPSLQLFRCLGWEERESKEFACPNLDNAPSASPWNSDPDPVGMSEFRIELITHPHRVLRA